MRKSDVPWIYTGPVLKGFIVFVIVGFSLTELSEPHFQKDLPGALDCAIGLICGLLFAWIGSKISRPYKIDDLCSMKDSLWGWLAIGSFSTWKLIFAISYFGAIISAWILTAWLVSWTGLGSPWFQRAEYAAGATFAAFLTFVITTLVCDALWYDSLPD